jgi:hypothetical protein
MEQLLYEEREAVRSMTDALLIMTYALFTKLLVPSTEHAGTNLKDGNEASRHANGWIGVFIVCAQ